MSRILYAFAAAAPALAGLAHGPAARSTAAADSTEPVLLELFTSQGCSSCPPGDALAERLAAEPGLVVISRPVTY